MNHPAPEANSPIAHWGCRAGITPAWLPQGTINVHSAATYCFGVLGSSRSIMRCCWGSSWWQTGSIWPTSRISWKTPCMVTGLHQGHSKGGPWRWLMKVLDVGGSFSRSEQVPCRARAEPSRWRNSPTRSLRVPYQGGRDPCCLNCA